MLDAQLLVLDLIRTLRPLVERMRVTQPDLAKQLVRAANGVGLNLAEGFGRYGADKRRVYRLASAEAKEVKAALEIAAAEVHEVRAALEVALAWGLVAAPAIAPAQALADRVGRVTYALAR